MILTPDKIADLMPLLKLSVIKRQFIMLNGTVATLCNAQKIWGLPDDIQYPNLRLNWKVREDGTSISGYNGESEYGPVVIGLCQWLEKLDCKDPEPEITVVFGWKIYFDGSPIGAKFDFMDTKGSKCFFPKEFYNTFPCFFTKEDCFLVLKKQVAYMLDQLKLKGHYASLREPVAEKLRELGYI